MSRANESSPTTDNAVTQPLSYRTLKWLILLVAVAIASGRIASVTRDNKTPFVSANDRSRWCTIRALVDHGTYAIDDIIFNEQGERIKEWHTIDLVRHRAADGREHYYSSKPVLMPTLMAGVYAVVKNVTGRTLAEDPFFVGRLVLWFCNLPPLLLFWWMLSRLIDEHAEHEWTRLMALLATCFGCFPVTYAIALNNHLHAVVCVTAAVFFWREIVHAKRGELWRYAACGLFSALVFANELPGLAFLAGMACLLLWHNWSRTLISFLPASGAIVVAIYLLNFLVHDSWREPYAHRRDGPVIASGSLTDVHALRNGNGEELQRVFDILDLSDNLILTPRLQVNPDDDISDRWNLFDEQSQRRFAVRLSNPEAGGVEIRAWDNWYEYPGTNWQQGVKKGVDEGEPSPLVYAFHCLVGHHGLFSLTPLWIFSLAGMVIWISRGTHFERALATGTLLLSGVCLAFYLSRPLNDRNYGGACNGLRWMMWFTPLYLVGMLPAIDWAATSRTGRALVLIALGIGIFSVSYKPLNCFSHPWLFELLEQLRLTNYAG